MAGEGMSKRFVICMLACPQSKLANRKLPRNSSETPLGLHMPVQLEHIKESWDKLNGRQLQDEPEGDGDTEEDEGDDDAANTGKSASGKDDEDNGTETTARRSSQRRLPR